MDSDNIVLASNYRLMATNFQMSAKILHEKFNLDNEPLVGNRRAIPFYYLLSHACELLLKRALLKRGINEKELKSKRLRHNLCNLLAELEKKNVEVSSESKEILIFLNDQHDSHSLRYKALLSGVKTYTPDPDLIYKTLDELLLCTRERTMI